MYHVGQSTKRRHRLRRLLVALGLLVVVAGCLLAKQALKSDTVIHEGIPTTTHVAIAEPKTQLIAKPGFQLSLPADWKEVTDNSTYTEYSWQGTLKTDDARRLDVYVDNLPTTMAVNRLLPLQDQGTGVLPTDNVSDNCINFTNKDTANPATGAAPAKWSGVNFLCDTANYLREVVGTGSLDGINTVSVRGSSGAVHRYFFVYTDQSAQLDFQTLTTILSSFHAL